MNTELILFKCKTSQLDKIRNLNLCANNLNEISLVSQMTSLEVLSLSVNNISTLKDIGQCSNLQELYIRRNAVSAISELNYLKPLPKLRILWLEDNPIASTPNYRTKVIQELP